MKIVFRILTLLWFTLASETLWSQENTDPFQADSVTAVEEEPRKLSLIRRIIRGFDRLDTNYIEPQHYVFTLMLQGTYTYDYYTINSNDSPSQSISFAPDGSFKVGPFFIWKWFFGGYTFTLGHNAYSKTKTEIDFSLYSSQIGIDLFYRRTGSDYKLRNVRVGRHDVERRMEDAPIDGMQVGITGANLYYIFNHGRFSYPAAFAQSTCQKISCGSWLAGIGLTKNSLELDYEKLQDLLDRELPNQTVRLDSSLMFRSAKYYHVSISGGYAYNWVFAPQWLFCASGQAALAYKKSTGKTASDDPEESRFSFTRINPNFVGRFGLVYNNTKWYVGLSAVVRSNYYLDSRFTTNNTFGSFNVYTGFNFGLKKKYRKKE